MAARDWSPEEPWNRLPLLLPAADLESKSILRACITARATLAELAQAVKLILQQQSAGRENCSSTGVSWPC